MNLVITYNDKAFAYFGENHNPVFYEEEITQALGGLAPVLQSSRSDFSGFY